MDPARLKDRVYRGLNTAARAVGVDTDAYRPSGATDPLAPNNRFLRLRVAFTAHDGRFAHPNEYGEALNYGIFDAAYTRPGDYLRSTRWRVVHRCSTKTFTGALCPDQPDRFVFAPSGSRQRRRQQVWRDDRRDQAAIAYELACECLGCFSTWSSNADLPGDTSAPYWTVLLPAVPGVVLLPSDLMSDDLGRNAVVAAAELTELGWRVAVKQATT